MAALHIHLFGIVQILHHGRPQDARLIHGAQSLLAWLLLHRRKTHTREALAALFWGEQSETRARSCLSTALWRLRHHRYVPPTSPISSRVVTQTAVAASESLELVAVLL